MRDGDALTRIATAFGVQDPDHPLPSSFTVKACAVEHETCSTRLDPGSPVAFLNVVAARLNHTFS
jgi:hypothetical protein